MTQPTFNLTPIPAFSDNYIWLIDNGSEALVVDPGDAGPVFEALERRSLRLSTVLITHHHPDHTGGIDSLTVAFSPRIVGPGGETAAIKGLTETVKEGDHFTALGTGFEVLEIGGHTLGHIAFHARALVEGGALFCGDTLFAAGCGRVFEGTMRQMYGSLTKLAALPASTQICCGHEYTLSNLAFALAVEPQNDEIRGRAEEVRKLRSEGRPSLPSSMGVEHRTNPFLRCEQATIRCAAQRHQAGCDDPVSVFTTLRSWKDGFRVPADF